MIATSIVRALRRRRAAPPAEPEPEPPALRPGTPRPRREAPPPGTDVIRAEGLVKRYGELTAVGDVSFSVAPGEIFGLLGPNGAGKTTTLEMLEGLRSPDSGRALVFGEPMTPGARHLKERIGVQLQATALPAYTRVVEAIDLFAAFFEHTRGTADLLEEFDLEAKAGAMATTLSGGQMQRLSLALALVNDPDLVFLDEPTTGLDPAARLDLWGVIERIRAAGTTVVLTTHYMEEAERLCDRIAVMDHGVIVAMDTPSRLIAVHAPASQVEFEVPQPVEAAVFTAMPAVDGAEVRGQEVSLATTSPQTVLAQLFAPGAAALSITNLRVRAGTLEDVFITLTGRRLREP